MTARALTRRDCSAVDLIQDVQPPAAPSSTLSSRFRRFFDNKSTFDADHVLVVNQTVAEATYDVLRRFGVDRVFGNPGSTEMRMFVRWPDDLDYVLALQEASVVAMADGFAQRSRRPSVANVHTAAGLGNAMGSLITAWRNQTPLVITAGQQTRAMLPTEPYLSSPQSILLPQPYVKWAIEPARAADVPGAVARALLAATTPPCGPAFVSIPEDDWDAEPAQVPSHTVVPALGADPRAIERFAEMLTAATAPAIVVGPQVDGDGAGADAVALAERLKAAVYVAPWSSRCSFPERHPLFQGFLTASRQAVVRQLDGHDAVLIVGAQIFTYHVHTDGPFLPDGATALHITDNPIHAFSAPVGDSVLCSAGLGIRALLDHLPDTSRSAIAEGLGVKGIRGDHAADLRDVLREALTFDGPALVDVSVAALRGVGPI